MPTVAHDDPHYWSHALLTAEEERALAVRVRAGDWAAREELVLKNQRLVVAIARLYLGGFHALPDLVSAGNLGLIRAAEMFDPDRNTRFATYATRWVHATIQREVIASGYTIRLAAWVNDLVRRYEKTERRLAATSKHPGPPPFDDVCRALGLKPRWQSCLADALRARRAEYSADHAWWQSCLADALRARRAEYSADHAWSIPAREVPEPDLDAGRRREVVSGLLARLTPRQREAIRLSFGLGDEPSSSMPEIGRRLGCSGNAARHARDTGLRALRENAGTRHAAMTP